LRHSACGIEQALWQLGGVPKQHRTDHLTAAVHQLPKEQREEWTARYQALMVHYGMEPTTNNTGVAHENGDVEQAHHRFKEALDQALRVRGSRDFPDRAAYERFVAELVKQRNQTRKARFKEEQRALSSLPRAPLSPCSELRVRVSRFSTMTVLGNTYSVPSRLIGTRILVRVRAERLEGYVGTKMAFSVPRLVGKQLKCIDYRHVIWSLVKKPGAFAAYRYREELFPTTTFRLAYDRLTSLLPRRADREYVRLLHLAAGHSECEVETALSILLEVKSPPTVEAVRDLLGLSRSGPTPALAAPTLDLTPYDRFLPSARRSHV
jgi:ribosomal protein S21